MLTLERREHLDQLHELQVGESLTLEYKASDAISNAPSAKVELARDVSAFANAAGGQIVYGMTEADHLPAGLDGGLERARFPGLWFEQVLQAHVSPAIEGLVLREIELGEGRIAAVITVPPAGARAPHQVSDGRYYRRRNFQRTHMEDYEVREAMRRHVQPEPYVTIALEAEPTPVVWPQPETHSTPIPLRMAVGNRSREPALYTLARVWLDRSIVVSLHGADNLEQGQFPSGTPANVLIFKMMVPSHFPLFKETVFRLGGGTRIAISPEHRDSDMRYEVMYDITTPGFAMSQRGFLLKQNNRLRIVWAG